nr:integrase, catalytic region, zinc finger, CCHC-type, peptidase aspartic, catalytic [Tanacetum cinerariifolium]
QSRRAYRWFYHEDSFVVSRRIFTMVERFMNYLEEQTDEEAMINSIKNGDQPLPRVNQVFIVGTSLTEQPPLKDKSMWSSNASNVDLSSDSNLKLNKDVKRYSHKDLLSCNISYLGETSSAYVCNDAMNVSCDFRFCDSFDENNLFIFDDESVRIYSVSKMPFRKKPRDSMNVRSKSNSNNLYLELCIDYRCLWIIDSGCSKHMTGNHALLTNFVKKFLGTVRFGNNDFAVIAGYGDVVIGSIGISSLLAV